MGSIWRTGSFLVKGASEFTSGGYDKAARSFDNRCMMTVHHAPSRHCHTDTCVGYMTGCHPYVLCKLPLTQSNSGRVSLLQRHEPGLEGQSGHGHRRKPGHWLPDCSGAAGSAAAWTMEATTVQCDRLSPPLAVHQTQSHSIGALQDLAARNCTLLMVCRQEEKGKQAVKEVIKVSGDGCFVPACLTGHLWAPVTFRDLTLLPTPHVVLQVTRTCIWACVTSPAWTACDPLQLSTSAAASLCMCW